MHVMYVIPNLDVGGAETLLLAQLPLLIQAGVEPLVVTVSGGSALLENHSLPARHVALALPRARGWMGGLPLSVKLMRHLRRVIKTERPDLVHLNLYRTDAWGRLAARGFCPTLTSWHNTDPWMASRSLNNRVRVAVEHWTGGRSDACFLAVSAATRDHGLRYLRVPATRVRLIYNGIDLTPYAATPPVRDHTSPRIVMIGRFYPQKAHDVAVAALAQVRAAGHEFRADLLGDGPLRPAIQADLQRRGLTDWVQAAGVCHDVPAALPGYDLCIMPSRFEGLPMALIESMAAFVPPVATRVGGIPEVIRDGENGRLVPPEDPDALAAAIVELLSDEQRRRALALAGRATVERDFNLAVQVPRMVAYYQEILDRAGSRPAR
jgi:glycosyltransferase involved in cell wall biosynthesis